MGSRQCGGSEKLTKSTANGTGGHCHVSLEHLMQAGGLWQAKRPTDLHVHGFTHEGVPITRAKRKQYQSISSGVAGSI